jgi:hypothetical protein
MSSFNWLECNPGHENQREKDEKRQKKIRL